MPRSTHEQKSHTDKPHRTATNRKSSHKSTPSATLKDLCEEDRQKYEDALDSKMRLEEQKADLNEQCDAKDAEIIHFQQRYEEELTSNQVNVKRLTDIVSALEGQRTEAFELLQTYQNRIEQLCGVIRKYEKDEMGGERKKVMLANIASLEDLVENQKCTIESLNEDRSSLIEAHKNKLSVLQQLCDHKMKEIEVKRESLEKAEQRSSAVEMACARLTKQITEMHRKDGVKTAEIEALKKLLADSVLNKPKNSHPEGLNSNEETNGDKDASQRTNGHVTTKERYRDGSPSTRRAKNMESSTSPKRKLSAALKSSRGSGKQQVLFQKDRDNADFLLTARENLGLTAQPDNEPRRTSGTRKVLSPGPGTGRGAASISASAGTSSNGRDRSEAVTTRRKKISTSDMVTSRLSLETRGRAASEAAIRREQEIAVERAHQIEINKRKAARQANARLRDIHSVDIIDLSESVSPSPSRLKAASASAGSVKAATKGPTGKKQEGSPLGKRIVTKRTAEKEKVEAPLATSRAGADSASLTTAPPRARASVTARGRSGNIKSRKEQNTVAQNKPKTPLKVVIGERRQYDPSLLTVLSAIEG